MPARKLKPRRGRPPAKEPMKLFSVRLSVVERAALEQAAAADDRPAAVLMRRITKEWLKENGWLKS
jgi:hypothetical protein